VKRSEEVERGRKMKENFNSLGVHAQEQKNKERETHAVYFKNAKNIGNYF